MKFGDWWRESPMSKTRPELYGICEAVWLAAQSASPEAGTIEKSLSFYKQQELAVLDSALGYLVRDKIIDNITRCRYLQAFGERALSNAARSEE